MKARKKREDLTSFVQEYESSIENMALKSFL
jgi:hypothetical protein